MTINTISVFLSLFVFLLVMAVMMACKTLSRPEIDVSMFNVELYPGGRPKKEEVKKKKTKERLPLNKAAPLIIVGGILISLGLYSMSGVGWLSICGLAGGLIFPKLWLDWRIAAQKSELDGAMEQAMETIAVTIRSGGSVPDAFERASVDSTAPLNLYLLETATRIRTGMSQAESIRLFQEQVGMRELSVIGIGTQLLQRGMPVILNEMFLEAQGAIRDRVAFRREKEKLTAEPKLVTKAAAAMPFLLMAVMRQMAPEIMAPSFTTMSGLIVFAVCTMFIAFGVFILMQMAKSTI